MLFSFRRGAALAAMTATFLIPLAAQSQTTTYHGRRAWLLQNSQMKVIITPGGGHIASMTLKSGPGANLNPLWLPPWPSVEPGVWTRSGGKYGDKPGAQLLSSILGHNLCLDFFGAPSAAETAAGVPVHGEAPCVLWQASSRTGNAITYTAELPLAQMRVRRAIKLGPNAATLWITESVENLSAFDRPFGWQQHPTLGPPFLAPGESYFDMPGTRSLVYPREFSKGERLKRGEEFEWPNAPGANGESVDLRNWPVGRKSSDYTATLIDPAKTWGWFTAINTKQRLLIGYVWPRKDWPWVGNWEENRFRDGKPWLGKGLTRGMEFGTTPFPDSRRDAISLGTLFDTPTYRWIGARQKQTVGYGAFLASIPPGTTGVRDVLVEGNRLKIVLEGVERTITLPLAR
jgi:hypothetical protein